MPGPDGRDTGAGADAPGALSVPFRPLAVSEMLDGSIAGIRRRPPAVAGLSVPISTMIQVASLVRLPLHRWRAREESGLRTCCSIPRGAAHPPVLGLVLSAYGILLLAGLLAPVLGRGLVRACRCPHVRPGGTPVPGSRGACGRHLAAVGGTLVARTVLPSAVPPAARRRTRPAPASCRRGRGGSSAVGIGLMVWLYILFVLAVPRGRLEREPVAGALRAR